MWKAAVYCIKIGIAALVSLTLLSLFTVLYSHTGVHIKNETGATDYKWEPNQFKSNMSEGFSWIKMNADGFNNSYNVTDVDNIDILLMGSSHMEAVNVPSNSNTGYLLNNKEIPEYVTYNIGVSGHTIYQCVNNLSDAVKTYNPSKYIIIESDRVILDKEMMEEVIDGRLPLIPSFDSGLTYRIQKNIPCFLPLYREIDNWMTADKRSLDGNTLSNEKIIENKEDYINLLNKFLDLIIDSADGRKVIILYNTKTTLGDDSLLTHEDKESVNMFNIACNEHNIVFVDMYADFCQEYEKNHKLAHGFINTEIGEGHLNKTGHKLVAKRLGAVIKEIEDGTE